MPNDRFWRVAQAIEKGLTLPELILIGTSPDTLVALEGNVRLTAYLLAWDAAPDELPILVGLSPNFNCW